MKYEFTFIIGPDDDPFYITHHKPHIDEELLLFLIDIDFPFEDIISFKVEEL